MKESLIFILLLIINSLVGLKDYAFNKFEEVYKYINRSIKKWVPEETIRSLLSLLIPMFIIFILLDLFIFKFLFIFFDLNIFYLMNLKADIMIILKKNLSEAFDIMVVIIKIFITLIFVLLVCAFMTLLERKFIGSAQRRKGPNVVGYSGLLQPISDGVKLILKETILPTKSNRFIFFLSPALTFILGLTCWCIVPFGKGLVIADIPLGISLVLAVSSLAVYGVLMGGWSSNSKYAFLGSLRSAAQMISYEIALTIIIVNVMILSGSLNFTSIVECQNNLWFSFTIFPSFLLFFVCSLAETNRAPFDLPESEAELVAGYNVEYSGVTFALFFLGEYSFIYLMCTLITIFFFGGWHCSIFPIPDFICHSLKVCFFILLFFGVRLAFPRYRYDALMSLGWKGILPLSFGYFIFFTFFYIQEYYVMLDILLLEDHGIFI